MIAMRCVIVTRPIFLNRICNLFCSSYLCSRNNVLPLNEQIANTVYCVDEEAGAQFVETSEDVEIVKRCGVDTITVHK